MPDDERHHHDAPATGALRPDEPYPDPVAVASDPSLRGILRRLRDRFKDDDLLGLSAEMAFRFLFAVFPFGLFVAAVAAFVAVALNLDNPAQQIVGGLGDNLPPAIAEALRPELERLISSPRADLLSFGALAALWAGTGGTNALVKGIHRAYDIPEARPLVLRYAIAVGLTLLGAFAVIGSFVTIVGGAMLTQEIAEGFGMRAEAFVLIQLLRWPAVGILLTLAVAVIYRYAPNIVVPWRWVLTGSAVFTLAWVLATAALSFYVTRIANYGATYGSLAGVIVLMVWFYMTALTLLIGAETAAALAWSKSPNEITVRHEEAKAAAAVENATGVLHGIGEATEQMGKGRLSRPTG